jgi:hypothetical protein
LRLFISLLARLLQLGGALVTWYGANAMFTSDGIKPPNMVVLLGVAVIFLAGIVAARSQPEPKTGWWLALALISVPFVLLAMPSGSGPECPPAHAPLTELYNCVPPRPLAVFLLGLAGIGVAIWGAWRDIAALRRADRAHP